MKNANNAFQTEVCGIRSRCTTKQGKASESVFLIFKTLSSVQQEPSYTTENWQFWHMIELFLFLLASFMKVKHQQTGLQSCTHSSAATTACLWAEKWQKPVNILGESVDCMERTSVRQDVFVKY